MNIKSKTIVVTDGRYENGRLKSPAPRSYKIVVEKHVIFEDGSLGNETIQEIMVEPWIYSATLIGYTIVALILAILAVSFGDVNSTFGWGGAVLGLLVMHFLFSFSQVNENERAGVLFFGAPVREFNPGFVFHPMGILELKKLPKSPIQVQFPGDPEKVYKGSDEEYFKLPEDGRKGHVLPIRAVTGKSKGDTAGEAGILNSQMTLEVTFYVRWVIEQFWLYLVTVGDQEETNRQFRDSGERVIIQEIAKRTVAEVVEELHAINDALATRFEEITQDYGVKIVETAMLSPDINHKVNESLRDVVNAKAKGIQTVIAANAERVRLTEIGAGEAAAKLAELDALSKGAKALGVFAGDVIDLEKTRAMAQGNATVIVDGGSKASGIVGLGARLVIGADSTRNNSKKSTGENDA